jgi:AcrR family transcriptional regulator/DNA-binding MarR family transcriptional regulator
MGATRAGVDVGATQAYDEFARSQVAELQRARILAAMFDVAAERGAANVSVAHVVSRSGVSRRTFYDVFTDREDCFLAAFERALSLTRERVLDACEGQGSWRERIRAGLIAFLGLLEDEPRLARVLVCESAAGGSRVLQRRAETIEQIARAVDEGRLESKGAAQLSPLTAEGIVGGALSVIQGRLAPVAPSAHQSEQTLLALTGPLMSTIVLPYLGPAAARKELTRAVTRDMPATVNGSSTYTGGTLAADPFKAAGMRLTYRTVRVLTELAALGERGSGPSNRQIGDAAGIGDQGQISKLLHRLQRAGLIENTGLDASRGMPNAWSLTAAGRRVVHTINTHTEDTSGTTAREDSKPTGKQTTANPRASKPNGKHTERTK